MEALGFSINTLTLFGMVLAIGMVVDDAIVVVENVERHMAEEKLLLQGGGQAGDAGSHRTGDRHRTGLGAVFVPVGFLGGITGQLYKQFAITIAMSVAISGSVALTLSPALAAILLKPGHRAQPGRFFRTFNRFFEWTQHRYTTNVGKVLKHAGLSIAIFAVLDHRRCEPLQIHSRAASCRKRIKAILLPPCNCRTGRRRNGPMSWSASLKNTFCRFPRFTVPMLLVGQNFIFGTRGSNTATMFTPLHLWDQRKRPDNM